MTFKERDIVKVIGLIPDWTAGLRGKVVKIDMTRQPAPVVVVEFDDSDAQGSGHDGGMGDSSVSRWWLSESNLKLLFRETTTSPPPLPVYDETRRPREVDWFALNKEFST